MRNPNRLKAVAAVATIAGIGSALLTGCGASKPAATLPGFFRFAESVEAQPLHWNKSTIAGEWAVNKTGKGFIVDTEVFTTATQNENHNGLVLLLNQPNEVDIAIYPPGTKISASDPDAMTNGYAPQPVQEYSLTAAGTQTSDNIDSLVASAQYMGNQMVTVNDNTSTTYNSHGEIVYHTTSVRDALLTARAIENQAFGIVNTADHDGNIGPYTGVITQ